MRRRHRRRRFGQAPQPIELKDKILLGLSALLVVGGFWLTTLED